MRWALGWTCSPAGNTQRQARAAAAPRPLNGWSSPREKERSSGLFHVPGARGSSRLRGSHTRPPPLPVGLRPHQLCPSRDRGGHFDAIAKRAGCFSHGTRAQDPLSGPGSLYPRFLASRAPLQIGCWVRNPAVSPAGNVGLAARQNRGGGKRLNFNLKRLFIAHARHLWPGNISYIMRAFALSTGEFSLAALTLCPGFPRFSSGLQ